MERPSRFRRPAGPRSFAYSAIPGLADSAGAKLPRPSGPDTLPLLSRRAMEMHVPPPARLPLPDARLFKRLCVHAAVRREALVEADIRHDGHVAEDTDA